MARLAAWLIAVQLWTNTAADAVAARPTTYETPSIHLQTDLEAEAAKELAARLQATAEQLAGELGKPLHQPIEVKVVQNLANWPADAIPADARKQIAARAGTTITERLTEDGKPVSLRSTVYSCADGRTPRHELVHAYCWQVFGRVGPDWFSEGLAELFANRKPGGAEMAAPRYMLDYLRTDPAPPTPAAIVADALGDRKPWQRYAHRWALCYLLSHHPNDSARFWQFARALLEGEDADFHRTFADRLDPIGVEYRKFIGQVTPRSN